MKAETMICHLILIFFIFIFILPFIKKQYIWSCFPVLSERSVRLTKMNLLPLRFWDCLGDPACPESDPTSGQSVLSLWPAFCWHAWPCGHNAPERKPYCRDHTCKKTTIHCIAIIYRKAEYMPKSYHQSYYNTIYY